MPEATKSFDPGIPFVTPPGRAVQGSWFVPSLTDMDNKPRVYKSGPKIGQPRPEFSVVLAFAKTDPNFAILWAEIVKCAAKYWPSYFPYGPQPQYIAGPGIPCHPGDPAQNVPMMFAGGCTLQTFAWKLIDGDGMDRKGNRNDAKPGFKGHWCLRFANTTAPKLYYPGKYAPHEQIVDQNLECTKRGHVFAIGGHMKGNESTQTAGVYLNLEAGDFIAYMEAIASGFETDPNQTLGSQTRAAMGYTNTLPAGATTAAPASGLGAVVGGAPPPPVSAAPPPLAPPPGPAAAPPPAPPAAFPSQVGTMTAAPAPVAPPPAPAAPAPTPPPAPVAHTPNYDPMMTAPPPAGPTMTAKAGVTTYEGFKAAGWTDAQLIADGMMVATAPPLAAAPPPPAPAAPPPLAPAVQQLRAMTAAANGVTYEAYIGAGWTDAALLQGGLMTIDTVPV